MHMLIVIFNLMNIVTYVSSQEQQVLLQDPQRAPVYGQYAFVVVLANIDPIFNITTRFCTATMLKPFWAITAAHCNFAMSNLDSVNIWYGQYTKSPLATKLYAKVLQIYTHPTYNYAHLTVTYLKNDLCLLHVQEVRLSSYARVLSNDYRSITGQTAKYVHTGKPFLQNSMYDIVYKEGMISPCEKKVYQLVGKHFVCISTTCIADKSRTADNGGPLLFNGDIMAVSSGTQEGYVEMECFMPIIDYVDWINEVVNDTDAVNINL